MKYSIGQNMKVRKLTGVYRITDVKEVYSDRFRYTLRAQTPDCIYPFVDGWEDDLALANLQEEIDESIAKPPEGSQRKLVPLKEEPPDPSITSGVSVTLRGFKTPPHVSFEYKDHVFHLIISKD